MDLGLIRAVLELQEREGADARGGGGGVVWGVLCPPPARFRGGLHCLHFLLVVARVWGNRSIYWPLAAFSQERSIRVDACRQEVLWQVAGGCRFLCR